MPPHTSSLEHAIYRNLATQIQLDFFSDDNPFPSVQEIARQYRVSYCPAQRALKALARDGLVKIERGKETVVLKKEHESYHESAVFQERLAALDDLCRSLQLLSPAVAFHGAAHLDGAALPAATDRGGDARLWRNLYRLFEQALAALGNQIALSLYYDINAFVESAFAENLRALCGEAETLRFLRCLEQDFAESIRSCQGGGPAAAQRRLEQLGEAFFARQCTYLRLAAAGAALPEQQAFLWTPRKGRARYCDLIAIDLIRKIRQGAYPLGTLLPSKSALADMYHVSAITIRRAVELLNCLGITRTHNGVGTRVLSTGDTAIAKRREVLMLDDSLRTFLEALQFLLITGEPVLRHTFSHFTPAALRAILQAARIQEPNAAMTATTGACLQAVVRCSPLAAVREIYGKLTLLLLQGNALSLDGFERRSAKTWPAIAEALAAAAQTKHPQRFAAAFRRLIGDNFSAVKSHLQKKGAADIDAIVTPLFPD